MLEDDLSVLVDDVLRRPVLIVVGVPRRIVVVLRDRILDAMALDRGLDVAGHLLEWKLRCMNAYDDKPSFFVGVIQFRDVWQRAGAVDAPVCPEIDEDDFPAQISNAQWAGVEPVADTDKVWGDPWSLGLGSVGDRLSAGIESHRLTPR
jgi:hypothetical protein